MESVKKVWMVFFSCIVMFSMIVTNAQTRELDVTYGISIRLDGVVVEFEYGMRPFIVGDRTYLSVRAMADLLGLCVDFDDDARTVILGTDDTGRIICECGDRMCEITWSMSPNPQHWDLFEFPGEYFTDEITFLTEYGVYSLAVRRIIGRLNNAAHTPSLVHYSTRNIFVKLVGDEWREAPGYRIFHDIGLGPLPAGIDGWPDMISAPTGGFAAGRYRIVKDVVIERIETGEMENHLVWAEFVIEPEPHEVHVALNGVPVTFEYDMRPFIMNDRTFVSVRAIAQLFWLDVDYDEGTHTIILETTNASKIMTNRMICICKGTCCEYMQAAPFDMKTWRLFEFPNAYFTEEIIFLTESGVYPLGTQRVVATLTNSSVVPSSLRFRSGNVLVKQVGYEWRVVPRSTLFLNNEWFPRLTGQSSWGDVIDASHLVLGEFTVGTYRVVKEVELWPQWPGGFGASRHLVWAEFIIEHALN